MEIKEIGIVGYRKGQKKRGWTMKGLIYQMKEDELDLVSNEALLKSFKIHSDLNEETRFQQFDTRSKAQDRKTSYLNSLSLMTGLM